MATFEGLLAQQSPTTPQQHVVREDLLEHIRTQGDTPELHQHVFDVMQTLAHNAEVIVCTCSSLGAIAENLDLAIPVLRIDRALAEAASKQGKRILVLATLESTVEPTSSLFSGFFSEVNQHRVKVDIKLCEGAWEAFARGDSETYAKRIAETAQQHCQKHPYDVIALAQASMAIALSQSTFPAVATLTSPPLGVKAALDCLKHETHKHHPKESSC